MNVFFLSSFKEEDRMLLKEVGKSGNGSATEVDHWIEQGANPNLRNKDNVPALHVAVLNKHLDAIPSLVNNGADVNIRGPKCDATIHCKPQSFKLVVYRLSFSFQSRKHCAA